MKSEILPESAIRQVIVLVAAAGRGIRAGGGCPKQFRTLAGKPLIRWTIEALHACPNIDVIIPIIPAEYKDLCQSILCDLNKVTPPIIGGDSRQQSIKAGLSSLVVKDYDLILIHDAARPFISQSIISDIITSLMNGVKAIVPVIAINDTIRYKGDDLSLDRSHLWRVQTPQGFDFDTIINAHNTAATINFNAGDDATLVEAIGVKVETIAGSESNFKITSPDDWSLANKTLGQHHNDIRTGFGIDVHKLLPSDAADNCIRLGGIDIPFAKKLSGNSDADVALHAVTDALLGCIAGGDIGQHFPDDQAAWQGADSAIFLIKAAKLIAMQNGIINHIDLTIICQAPKISPFRDLMQERIAAILAIDKSRVSVKATTTETLGFTGRGEGICVQAIATVRLPS